MCVDYDSDFNRYEVNQILLPNVHYNIIHTGVNVFHNNNIIYQLLPNRNSVFL